MFQTFTGSSRRPRQVNLSGQQPNPFDGWGSSTSASGTQKSVAVAQAERQHRQQERERLNAAKRIQRTWRGHRSRRLLANARRAEFDHLQNVAHRNERRFSTIPQELKLLLSFFSADKLEDIQRLSGFGGKLLDASQEGRLPHDELRPLLYRLAVIITNALAR
jgi:ubiquitin-protein ligase E3 C